MAYAQEPSPSFSAIDDSGARITLQKSAQRIVTLTPNIAEILVASGGAKNLVGISSHTSYPKSITSLPIVADYNGIDLERLLVLKPDLVVMWWHNGDPTIQERLKEHHIPVYLSDPNDFNDIPNTIENFGRLMGTEKVAMKAAKHFRQEYQTLLKKYHSRWKIRTFYQVWDKPLLTTSNKTLIGKTLKLCGAENIFADLNAAVPNVDEELVLKKDPQVILTGREKNYNHHWADNWKRWLNLSAVKYKNLFTVNPDLIERYGPRLMQGAKEVCEKIELGRQHVLDSSNNSN